MFLGAQLAYSARVIAVLVSLLPLYLTLSTIKDAPFLSQKGRDITSNPIVILLIAYGTGYAALGDPGTTLNAMLALAIMACYIFVLRPDLGDRYFDTRYLKDTVKGKQE